IGLDFSAEQLAAGKRLAEREKVKVEMHLGDLAELVFLRADSIDVVLSSYALGLVEDLNRVFRQVHRVLKQGAPLVFSMPHPAQLALARRLPVGAADAGHPGPQGRDLTSAIRPWRWCGGSRRRWWRPASR